MKARPVEERYDSPLSLGQLKSGMVVAVGIDVRVRDGNTTFREVVERELVASSEAEDVLVDLEEAIPVLEDAAAELAAGGNKPPRPGITFVVGRSAAVESPPRILLLGRTTAVESPPSRFVLGRDSAALMVDKPAKGLEMLGTCEEGGRSAQI